MKKKTLSLMLSLMMCFSLLLGAFPAGAAEEPVPEELLKMAGDTASVPEENGEENSDIPDENASGTTSSEVAVDDDSVIEPTDDESTGNITIPQEAAEDDSVVADAAGKSSIQEESRVGVQSVEPQAVNTITVTMENGGNNLQDLVTLALRDTVGFTTAAQVQKLVVTGAADATFPRTDGIYLETVMTGVTELDCSEFYGTYADSVFSDNKKLATVKLALNTKQSKSMFSSCSNLITIGDTPGVVDLSGCAFYAERAFYRCSSITTVILAKNMALPYELFSCDYYQEKYNIKTVGYPDQIQTGVIDLTACASISSSSFFHAIISSSIVKLNTGVSISDNYWGHSAVVLCGNPVATNISSNVPTYFPVGTKITGSVSYENQHFYFPADTLTISGVSNGEIYYDLSSASSIEVTAKEDDSETEALYYMERTGGSDVLIATTPTLNSSPTAFVSSFTFKPGKTGTSNITVGVHTGNAKTSFRLIITDRRTLKTNINKADGMTASHYTAASWSKVTSALSEANTINFKVKATQMEINSANTTLASAISALVKVPTSVRLNVTSNQLTDKKQSFTLKATVLPTDAKNKAISWNSSKPSVATVTSGGKVTSKAFGTATITVTAKENGKKATCKVMVKKQKVSKIKFRTPAFTLAKKGANKDLSKYFTVAPSTATNKNVNWKSSDNKVVTVSKTGVITAKGDKGKATITATAKDGSNKKGKITVYIGQRVTNISFSGWYSDYNEYDIPMYKGSTYQIISYYYPGNAKCGMAVYLSSNTKVATVSSYGLVSAVGVGNAKITVLAGDGSGKKATLYVEVIKPYWE